MGLPRRKLSYQGRRESASKALLITAYEAGPSVNLDEILCHELLCVPVALAEMNGNLGTGSKAIGSQLLTETDVPCPPSLPTDEFGDDDATLIIDGQKH